MTSKHLLLILGSSFKTSVIDTSWIRLLSKLNGMPKKKKWFSKKKALMHEIDFQQLGTYFLWQMYLMSLAFPSPVRVFLKTTVRIPRCSVSPHKATNTKHGIFQKYCFFLDC